MNYRKEPLASGEYYHIFNRSIAKFVIFNDEEDFSRFTELLDLCRYMDFNYRYSAFKNLQPANQKAIKYSFSDNRLVEIVAYCIMPTHVHLLLKQVVDNGVTKFMSKVLNSYTRYFNTRHHRKGPLWEGHFKNVLVKNDEQLLHLTRYIHLNPSSAGLVKDPFEWANSSLAEYVNPAADNPICGFRGIIDLSPDRYRKFVLDQKDYQQSLALIKSHLIDNYSG